MMFINKVSLPEEVKEMAAESQDLSNKSIESLKEELQSQITKLKDTVEPLVKKIRVLPIPEI